MKEWISGRNPVYEVFRANLRQVFRLRVAVGIQEKGRLEEIINQARLLKIPVERVPRSVLDNLSDSHQGVALEVSGYPYSSLEEIIDHAHQQNEPLFILVLDLIQNPQNLGTLLRTAESAGVHGVILPLARAALVTPAVVNASSGASEHLRIAQVNLVQALEQIKDAGAWVVGLEGSPAAQPIQEIRLDGALALVVGNEGEGMRPLVRKTCDFIARLPMRGQVESLNASVAGSIALYLAFQARISS
jgi:23S rRNA (guanosine2251-2'-O)-methyltransferase